MNAALSESVSPKLAQELVTNPKLALWTMTMGSISLMVSLAWSNAFKSLFENNKNLKHHGPWVYAITVTIVSGLFVYLMMQADKTYHFTNK